MRTDGRIMHLEQGLHLISYSPAPQTALKKAQILTIIKVVNPTFHNRTLDAMECTKIQLLGKRRAKNVLLETV